MSLKQAVVYVVDDDHSFLKSMERLIAFMGFQPVCFASAQSFLSQPSYRHPSCLLLDVQLPDMDGLLLQRQLIQKGSSMPVIFMTGHGTIPMSVQAMKGGAIDFLPKPFEARALQDAVCKALEGDMLSRKKEIQAHKITALVDTLTSREKEVLQWVISGKLNKEIARALGTSEKTIKVHRSRVMQKTKTSSVAALVRLAEQANILPAAP